MKDASWDEVHLSRHTTDIAADLNAPRPALELAVAHFIATGNDDRGVYVGNHPPIPHLKKREPSNKVPSPVRKRTGGKPDDHFFSWKLTYLMKALKRYQERHGADSWVVEAITVNLPFLRSTSLAMQTKGPATAYGDALADRLKHLQRQPRFFLVLEDSADETLHAHLCMCFHPDDKQAIKQALRLDAHGNNASVRFQQVYRQYEPDPRQGDIDREMDAARAEARALGIPDDEDEVADPYSLYPQYDRRNSWYYRMAPIDIGWADYLSKNLHLGGPNFLVGKSGGKGRGYAQRELAREANALYVEARDNFLHHKRLAHQRQASG